MNVTIPSVAFYYARRKVVLYVARERSPNRDKAKELYLSANGEVKLTDIAAQLNVSDSQIRKWKSTDKWDLELNGALPKGNSNVTNKKGTKTQRTKEKKEPIAKEIEEVIGNDDLTDKQRLFCIYYLKLHNATKAYQKAYGCGYETAMVNGCRMLRNAKVEEELKRLKTERMNSSFLSTEDILQKYIDIAFADITDYIEFGRREAQLLEEGSKIVNYVNLKSSVEVDGTIITEVTQGRDGVKVKLADKMRALDFLAKYNGMLSADVVQKLEMEREKLALLKSKDVGIDASQQVIFEGEDDLED